MLSDLSVLFQKATSESDVKDGALTAGGANDASDQGELASERISLL